MCSRSSPLLRQPREHQKSIADMSFLHRLPKQDLLYFRGRDSTIRSCRTHKKEILFHPKEGYKSTLLFHLQRVAFLSIVDPEPKALSHPKAYWGDSKR